MRTLFGRIAALCAGIAVIILVVLAFIPKAAPQPEGTPNQNNTHQPTPPHTATVSGGESPDTPAPPTLPLSQNTGGNTVQPSTGSATPNISFLADGTLVRLYIPPELTAPQPGSEIKYTLSDKAYLKVSYQLGELQPSAAAVYFDWWEYENDRTPETMTPIEKEVSGVTALAVSRGDTTEGVQALFFQRDSIYIIIEIRYTTQQEYNILQTSLNSVRIEQQ